MKKFLVVTSMVVLLAASSLLIAEVSFDTLKSAVEKVVPAKFTLNEGQCWDNRSTKKVAFDGDKSKMETLTFTFRPGVDKFSETDLRMKTESYTWQGRDAIFADGSKVGMGSLSIILKNKAGKFTISHRIFGGTFLTKAEMEDMLSKIGLEELEK